MLSSVSPAAGRILVSEPFMADPNFKRSVILLTEYGRAGAIGFILNHVSGYILGDIMPDVSYAELPVYTGGPVGDNTLHFLHCIPDKINDGIAIGDGVFWGGDFEKVKELITTYQLRGEEIKFFAGYSGWTAQQLDNEIKEESWIVANGISKGSIFNRNESTLWREVVIGLGQRYAHIANFPENPALN